VCAQHFFLHGKPAGSCVDCNIVKHYRATNKHDVNSDGLVNCIDYAVLFKQDFDRRFAPQTALIIRNINHDTGMNHLLNAIRMPDGSLRFIEPQDRHEGSPRILWGNKYDPRYNMDETAYWSKYIK
jgi:hypothetical protein